MGEFVADMIKMCVWLEYTVMGTRSIVHGRVCGLLEGCQRQLEQFCSCQEKTLGNMEPALLCLVGNTRNIRQFLSFVYHTKHLSTER